VKRGLITWDRTEIPLETLERRLQHARRVLAERALLALVVYADLWRSNQARHLSNFMPYFNRALLVLPAEGGDPILLCGLSPRVYPWIRSVTVIQDVRSGGNFVGPLAAIAGERGWTRVGAIDFAGFPDDLHHGLRGAAFEIVDVPGDAVFAPGLDETELALRRNAAAIARGVVAEMLPDGVGRIDYEWVGRLEGRLRRAQAEDLVVLVATRGTRLAPASGRTLDDGHAISLALEYRGHWVRISRTQVGVEMERTLGNAFQAALDRGAFTSPEAVVEDLGGAYPYEWMRDRSLAPGAIFAMHLATGAGASRCTATPAGCRHGGRSCSSDTLCMSISVAGGRQLSAER
jgi:hypothetical protein